MLAPPPTHPVNYWIALSLPVGVVAFGALIFVVRLVRARRQTPPDPESLLLGAVSKSLHERGELAASLGELRTVHERLLDALPFGLLWIDQRQKVAALNQVGLELLGVTRGVVGLDASFVLEPFPWLSDALATKPGAFFRVDGHDRRWRLRRIEAPDKIGALLSFEDITEWEASERKAQLRERFAELGEMTAGVAHQLKNGLAVIQGHGQLLQRAGHVDAAAAVLQESDELNRVVQRFLQWAKPLTPRLETLRLDQVAQQVIVELHRRPSAQGRHMDIEGQGEAPGDPMLLHQALINLMENAVQATPQGGRVRLRIDNGLIEILDEGPGLGEETALKMLTPFESGRPGGTGLGLPLALKWINAQGAELKIQKRDEGGTRVEIRW
jgi:signal transduction histidine kinase